MDKRTPHCKLTTARALVSAGRVTATNSATSSARLLGMDLQGMCDVVQSLTKADFYKSMTTRQDHTVWQDVYRGKTGDGLPLYVKLTVIDSVLIVSFKEL